MDNFTELQDRIAALTPKGEQPAYPTFQLIGLPRVKAKVDKSGGWIYQAIKDEEIRFPCPLKLGKSSRWIEAEIDAWIARQAAARNKPPTQSRNPVGRYTKAEVAILEGKQA